MSAKDERDWSDSLDFESLADERENLESPETAGTDHQSFDGDTDDGFGEDFQDEFQDEFEDDFTEEFADELAEDPEEPALEEADADVPAPARKVVNSRRSAGVSGTGLGVLFAFSILVAAAGSGGALLTALGIEPASLWRPEGFSQLDQLLNLDRNPLNLVYIVMLATVLLTMLGAWAIARAVRQVGERAAQDATLLEKVAALRIDEDHGWQDPALKNHHALAAFVDENVGAWRLHEARQKRSTGLEGELQRLTRAAGKDSRDELSGRYDHPAVGSLADELVRLLDERASAQAESGAIRTKDREESDVLMRTITEIAGWNTSFTDQVGVQNAAATGLESGLQELASSLDGEHTDESLDEARRAVAQLRQELRESQSGDQKNEAVGYLHDLVERGTKLAFQIAMEVARLGPRGERLLPMTTTLEELTTNFRKVADRLDGVNDDGGDGAQLRWDSHLATLQERLVAAGGSHDDGLKRKLEDLVSVASQLTGRLGSLATGFDRQNERLQELGEGYATLTGVDYDHNAGTPDATQDLDEDDLGLTRFDPFSGESAEENDGPLAVDPFATGEPETDPILADLAETEPVVEPAVPPAAEPEPTPEPPVAATPPVPEPPVAVTPPAPEPPVAVTPPAPEPPVAVTPPAPEPPVAATPPTPEPPVAAAPPVSEPPVAAAPPVPEPPVRESVYELQELGATPTGPPPAPVKPEPEETIHDLAEFDAVRLG